ncbi:MAG TPA: hypothetical protein VLE51_01085 [Candidatus Saccharimonadales bacterium]|nr:hypothetical protein [Candidatus Saccharimonadales bacterium]
MANSIESIQNSTDTLFEVLPTHSSFRGEVTTTPRTDGSIMEGLFVPYNFAVRGFRDLEEYKQAFLGLRRVKDSNLIAARHIITIRKDRPHDQSLPSYVNEVLVVDAGRLFTRALGYDSKIGNIRQPLEPTKSLRLASEAYIEAVAKKMSHVTEAVLANSTSVVPVTNP